MSGPTTFSYAQAAKGRTTPSANQPPATAQPDSHAKDDASSVTTGPDAGQNTFSTTSEISESAKSSQIEVEIAGSKKLEAAQEPDAPSSSSKDDFSGTAHDDTAKTTAHSATDKPTRSSNRSGEPTDSKKGRKGRKGRSSEKEAENEQILPEPEKEVVPVKLSEAPQPAVNIWVQRAAAAKAKQPSTVASPPATADSSHRAAPEAPTKPATNIETQKSESLRVSTKFTDARQSTDQSPRRNPRGNRVSDKGEQPQSVPSTAVEDVSLWPTPDTAAVDDGKRKASDAEQPSKEKPEDGNKSIRQKRDWKKVDITPSVVFNTPLPPRNPTKTRGGGQAGRSSAGGRGHASSVSISSEKGQGAASEVTGAKEGAESRGRPREDAAARANSGPSDKNKKFSVDQQAQRKPSVPSVNRGTGSSDYPSKNEGAKASKSESTPFTPSRGEGPEGWRKEAGFNGQKDSKPKRGGAHGNGRNGHTQQPFVPNGGARSNPYASSNYAPGYASNQFGGPNRAGGRGRPPVNGVKGPSSGAHRIHQPSLSAPDYAQYPVYGQAPYPPQTDLNTQSPADVLPLIHHALKQQIEYYFSDLNLTGDTFLKAQMDAQGFVPLDVICSFPRIIKIATEHNRNMVRQACADSKAIEFVFGDGQELIRVRGNWQKWVAEGGARNPGPTHIDYWSLATLQMQAYPQSPPMPYPAFNNPMSPQAYGQMPFPGEMYPGYMNGPRFPAAVNGTHVNGYSAGDNSGLNASVPEFAPGHSTPNGLHSAYTTISWEDQALQNAQTLTDEQLTGLRIVVQKENPKESSNGTADGSEDTVKTNGVHNETESLTTWVHLSSQRFCRQH